MPYVYLDDRFPDHEKVVRAGGDAGWLYTCGLCYVNRNLTGGRIPAGVVPRLTDRRAPLKLAERLVEVNLWERDGDDFVVHDYAERNSTAEARRAKAKKAADTRWGNTDADAPGNASSIGQALLTHDDEQSTSSAGPGESPIPNPQSPSPTDVSTSSKHLGGCRPQPVEDASQSRTLTERLLSAVTREGTHIQREADTVIALCREHVDDLVIDEAIGQMLGLTQKAKHPRYLLPIVVKFARSRGVEMPDLELPKAVVA